MTSRPVLIAFSILVGLNVILSGTALAEVVDPKIIGVAGLVNTGITVGLYTYVRGNVAPWGTIAAQRDAVGTVRLGPAASDVLSGDANVGDHAKVEVKPPTIAEGI